MKKNPTLVVVLIIIAITAVVFGGFFVYKYSATKTQPVVQNNLNILEVQYREKITVPDIGNDNELKNYQMFIKLDTMSLIQEHSLSFDCSNIYFTDIQGTKIPFWLADGQCYSKDSIFWLNIPSIAPHESKTIYVYYGNKNIASSSSYDKVFPAQNTQGLVAGYFLGPLIMGKDFSGYGRNGNEDFFSGQYQEYMMDAPTFNHWGCGGEYDYRACDQSDFNSVNFTAPSPAGADFSQGTMEMWVNPYVVVSDNYQRIISDSNNSMELGIKPDGGLYFYPSQAGGENYNLVKNALSDGTWKHIVVTWDFAKKESTFYINGKKRANDIENVPAHWTQKTKIGDKWKIGEFAFAGELSGLRIYSKVLGEQDVANAYISDSQSAIGPQIVLGKEEVVSKAGKMPSPFDNNGDIEKLTITDKINLTRHYSVPTEGDGINSDSQMLSESGKYSGFTYNSNHVYLVSKNGDMQNENVIFGVPSHLDAYSGTPISVKGSFLLAYIGLKISDPALIKNLYVELGSGGAGWLNSMAENTNGNFIDSFIPTAYACGVGSYVPIGNSELDFVKAQSGIYWYALKTPILASNADTLQISYIPNGKEGFLSIGLADMLFQDESQNFVRINQGSGQSDNYYAYLAPEENGKIEFKQDGQNKNLLLLFENQGHDAFKIDQDSLNYIRTVYRETIKNINIRDSGGNILYSIPMEDIKNNILGKTIEPTSEISMSVPLNSLSDNASYWITLEYDKSNPAISADQNQRKIIHWTLGDNPYFYPLPAKNWSDGTLYELDINGAGKMSFIAPAT